VKASLGRQKGVMAIGEDSGDEEIFGKPGGGWTRVFLARLNGF